MAEKKYNQYSAVSNFKTIDPNQILSITMNDGKIYVLNNDQQVQKSNPVIKNKPSFDIGHHYDTKKLFNNNYQQSNNRTENEATFPEKQYYQKINNNTIKTINFCRKTTPGVITMNRDKYFINKRPTECIPSDFSKTNYLNYQKRKPFIKTNNNTQIENKHQKILSFNVDNHYQKCKINNKNINYAPKLQIMNNNLYQSNNYNINNQNNKFKMNQNEIRENTNIISEKRNHSFFERKVIRNKPLQKTPDKYYYVQNTDIYLNEEKKSQRIPNRQPIKNNFSIKNQNNNSNKDYNSNNINRMKINLNPKNERNIQHLNNIDTNTNNNEQKVKKEIIFNKVITFGENENNDMRNSKNYEIKGSLNKVDSLSKGSKNYEIVNKVFTFGEN